MRIASIIVRWVAVLVPRRLRQEWTSEWLAELEHASRSRRLFGLPLALRALESVTDAVWIRVSGWDLGAGGDALRNATRSLVRHPGYSLTVIGTLALGVGGATAIFTVVDALLLRPIPFVEPDELVSLSPSAQSFTSIDRDALREWRTHEEMFVDVRALAPSFSVLTGAGEARAEPAWRAEPGFLEMLGIRPVLGRSFTPDDAVPGNDRVVLLGDDLWASAFGRSRDVVGRTIELNGDPHTIIGVLPPTLRRIPIAIVSMLLPLSEPLPNRVFTLARLRPGVPLESAQVRIDDVARALVAERPREAGWDMTLWPIERTRSSGADVRNGLLALSGAVFLLLLIASANAAGLLLLRGVSRRGELGLRHALGASRGTLLTHVLVESVVLALVAGVLGIVLARWVVRGLVALLPESIVLFSYTTISIDGRVLAFALGLTLVTAVFFGLAPAVRESGSVVRRGRTSTGSREDVRLRAGLQVAQLALAVVLVAGAALFVRSFQRIMAVPLGYDVDRVLHIELVSLEGLRGREATVELARTMDERLAALPGITVVGRTNGGGFTVDYTIETPEGETKVSGVDLADMLPFAYVDAGYLAAMGIPVAEGRGFEAGDLVEGSNNVIVDRDLAAALWPERSAVGRTFRIEDQPWLRVVGVTPDAKLEGPRDRFGSYMLFYPRSREDLRGGTIVLRTTGNAEASIPAVRSLVREIDPEQPIGRLQTGRQAVGDTVADPRLLLVVTVALSLVALALGVVGVYGLASFAVKQSRREIGIRMVLGAGATTVIGDLIRWGLTLGMAGVMIGLSGVVLVGRFLRSILFDTPPTEPTVLAFAAGTLLLACAAALVRPAIEAASTDPARMLRSE